MKDNALEPDILLVRVNEGYLVLHGHLRLVNALNLTGKAEAKISGGKSEVVVKTSDGVLVGDDQLPLLFADY